MHSSDSDAVLGVSSDEREPVGRQRRCFLVHAELRVLPFGGSNKGVYRLQDADAQEVVHRIIPLPFHRGQGRLGTGRSGRSGDNTLWAVFVPAMQRPSFPALPVGE